RLAQPAFDLAQVRVGDAGHVRQLAEREAGDAALLADELPEGAHPRLDVLHGHGERLCEVPSPESDYWVTTPYDGVVMGTTRSQSGAKTLAMSGSNCVPPMREISSAAYSRGRAARYEIGRASWRGRVRGWGVS